MGWGRGEAGESKREQNREGQQKGDGVMRGEARVMACGRDKEADRGDGHQRGEARAHNGWRSVSPLSCTLCRCLIAGCAGGEMSDPGAKEWRRQVDQAWGFSPCSRHPFPEMKYCLGFMSQICHLVALGTIAEEPTRQQWPWEGHGMSAA